MIEHRTDFLIVISAENCNPNGDPGNGNMPRQDMEGFGEISDVCIKRKIRNRMQDMGIPILNMANDRSDDGSHSISARLKACREFDDAMKEKTKDIYAKIKKCSEIACRTWMDVRCFGQVFPLKGGDQVSFPVRGPVSVSMAKSINPVEMEVQTITRSLCLEDVPGKTRDSATMGNKYIIKKGAYIAKGSIYPQIASLTGFSPEDVEIIHECLKSLFENDASSARPSGSMAVSRLYWWDHKGKTGVPSPSAVFRTLSFEPLEEYPFYKATETDSGLCPEIYSDDGFYN